MRPFALRELIKAQGYSPSLNVDFTVGQMLPAFITFTRASGGGRTNPSGNYEIVAADEPRFDYDPITLAARGFLTEEQRTNLLTYSEQFDNAAWSKGGCAASATATSPYGTATARSVVEDSATSAHSLTQVKSITAGQTVSHSKWVKASSGSRFVRLQFSSDAGVNGCRWLFNPDTGASALAAAAFGTGTVVSTKIEPWPNGWYRITLTGTVDPAATSVSFGTFLQDQAATYTATYTGNGASGVNIFGAQAEPGAFSSSYIPTTIAAATRAKDLPVTSTLTPWYNQAEGTWVLKWMMGHDSTSASILSVDDGIGDNLIRYRYSAGGGSCGPTVIVGTVAQASFSSSAQATAGVVYKSAFRYKANGFAVSFSGGPVSTDASGTIPTVTKVNFMSNWANGEQPSAWLQAATYYPAALPDAALMALSTT